MPTFPKVILRPGKELALKRFHPWVFSGAIDTVPEGTAEGQVVEVYSHGGDYLGTGHAQTGSIAVRILSFSMTGLEPAFWEQKFRTALNLREKLGLTGSNETNAFRLINGEGDLLPGLIIDMMAGTAVIQCHSVGMYLALESIVNALKAVLGDQMLSAYGKSAEALSRMSDYEATDGMLFGETLAGEIIENGLRMGVNLVEGQKTGYFLDQRMNRALLGSCSKGKRVLDTFCYSGGFALNALRGGARLVHAVDSSKRAIRLVEGNARLNGTFSGELRSFNSDAQKFLESAEAEYDIVVLDPPAFAKQLSMRTQALKGYRSINYQALKKILPGGMLFSFSCSQAVSRNDFTSAVLSAAIDAGREVRIIHHLSQGPDHPVNIFHPEGEYLKGLVLYVV